MLLPGRPATKSIALKLLLCAWTIRCTRCLVRGDSIPGPNNAKRGWNDPSWKLSRNRPLLCNWLLRWVWIKWNHFSHSLFPSLSLLTVRTAFWNSFEWSRKSSLLPWRVGSCIIADKDKSLSDSQWLFTDLLFSVLAPSNKRRICSWRLTRLLHKLSSCW